jgi:hypothetical protein
MGSVKMPNQNQHTPRKAIQYLAGTEVASRLSPISVNQFDDAETISVSSQLSQLGVIAATEALGDHDITVRRAALEYLKIEDHDVQKVVKVTEALGDHDITVRRAALEALESLELKDPKIQKVITEWILEALELRAAPKPSVNPCFFWICVEPEAVKINTRALFPVLELMHPHLDMKNRICIMSCAMSKNNDITQYKVMSIINAKIPSKNPPLLHENKGVRCDGISNGRSGLLDLKYIQYPDLLLKGDSAEELTHKTSELTWSN